MKARYEKNDEVALSLTTRVPLLHDSEDDSHPWTKCPLDTGPSLPLLHETQHSIGSEYEGFGRSRYVGGRWMDSIGHP